MSMTTREILDSLGNFSSFELELFEQHSVCKTLLKNELLLKEGEVCSCFYFILSGSFIQFQTVDTEEVIIDLHLPHEWMFNQPSLVAQQPSTTAIKAFSKSEIRALSLTDFHRLCAQSQSFLQLGKVLNQTNHRSFMFDHALSPHEKYHYINRSKPELTKVFPVKMVASYLKIAPETLSRVRAHY